MPHKGMTTCHGDCGESERSGVEKVGEIGTGPLGSDARTAKEGAIDAIEEEADTTERGEDSTKATASTGDARVGVKISPRLK